MQFTTTCDELAAAVCWAARALARTPANPVTAMMLIDAGADGVHFRCTDYETWTAGACAAEVTGPGSALVPGWLISEIVRSLPGGDGAVAITGDECAVTLESGKARHYTLSVAGDRTDFPSAPDVPDVVATVNAGDLAAAVLNVAASAGHESVDAVFASVLTDIGPDSVTLIASDKYRIARQSIPAVPASEAPPAFLIPAKPFTDAARGLPAACGNVTIAVARDDDGTPRLMAFTAGPHTSVTRLTAGQYKPYAAFFAQEEAHVFRADAGELAAMLQRLIITREKNTPARLMFDDGELTAETSAGSDTGRETIPVDWQDGPFTVCFNPDYLRQAVKPVQGTARIAITARKNTAVVTPADGASTYVHVLMPVRDPRPQLQPAAA